MDRPKGLQTLRKTDILLVVLNSLYEGQCLHWELLEIKKGGKHNVTQYNTMRFHRAHSSLIHPKHVSMND